MKAFVAFSLLLKMCVFYLNRKFKMKRLLHEWYCIFPIIWQKEHNILFSTFNNIKTTLPSWRFSSSLSRNQDLKGVSEAEHLSMRWIIAYTSVEPQERKQTFDLTYYSLHYFWETCKLRSDEKRNTMIQELRESLTKTPESCYRRIVSKILEYWESLQFHNGKGLIKPRGSVSRASCTVLPVLPSLVGWYQ